MTTKSTLVEQWSEVIDHKGSGEITDFRRREIMAQLLENQKVAAIEEAHVAGSVNLINESVPANTTAGVQNFDPVLISMVRRTEPKLMNYDIMGVQAMKQPTGLIFAMRARYSAQDGTEALFNEANTSFSASAAGNADSVAAIDETAPGSGQVGTNPILAAAGSGYTVEGGMSTVEGEALGGDPTNNNWQEMTMSIERITATAKLRALKAEYTAELAQDMKNVHGLSAESELANICTTEIIAEKNREAVRTVAYTASAGAQDGVQTAGTFDLDVDSNGRWSKERFQGLAFQIDREANAVYKDIRFGRGNIMICSHDVASALAFGGMLDWSGAGLDETSTYVGMLNGRIKVYVDPYATGNYAIVGYKGQNPYQAGLFYCPYIPLTMVRATGENTFTPKIGFKSRYAMVANPFATDAGDGEIAFAKKNKFYRIFGITNM